MKHFLLIPNEQKDCGLALTDRIKTMLEDMGAVCRISKEYHPGENTPVSVPEGTECILVIGGDGTILEAADRIVGKNIPMLGINLGTLGFLADVALEELPDRLQELVCDNYQVENRIMLEAKLYRNGVYEDSFTALNDFVINRSTFSKVLGLAVKVNGVMIGRYDADGVILCTPTGSTAYNLSAGGPIINPTCKNFVLTPICPHSIAARSIVLAGEDVVSIELESVRPGQAEDAVISADGTNMARLSPGALVRISKSKEVTPFIKMQPVSFVKILKDKLL